jgi:inward rectifier potassium channel
MSEQKDPGLGVNFQGQIKRIVNSDGSYNIQRKGGITGYRDLYKTLIHISWLKFILLAFTYYLLVNILFALLYITIGVEELSGVNNNYSDFFNAFFLSIHTFSSVGFGTIAPSGIWANMISVIEAFVGFISIAIITGLLYGRFSRPKSKIRFSNKLIKTRHNGSDAIMFKLVNCRNEILLNSNIKVLLTIDRASAQQDFQKDYHRLKLEVDSITFFPLSWTVVHIIDSESPMFNMSSDDLKDRNAEFIVLIESYDQTHQQTIMETKSYGHEEYMENVKFKRIFHANPEGRIVLHIDEIDDVIPLD